MNLLRSARFLRRALLPMLGAVWLAGWIVGEREAPWLWLYFIPAPVILVCGLIDLFVSRHDLRRWRTLPVLILTALAAWKTAGFDSRWHPRRVSSPDHAIRVVHWNIARAPFGYFSMFNQLRKDRPDLVILSESAPGDFWPNRRHSMLDLPFSFCDQGMAVLSRFAIEPQGTIPLPNARAWWARIALPDGPLDLVMCDLLSHPTLNRRAALEPLARWVGQHDSTIPLLVVGDFNTPRDARSFEPLRAHLRHAYEIAGRGWPYTWPLPFPVYSLDHAWVSGDITVHRYRLRTAPISDHRRQVLTISIDRAPSSSPE